VLAALLALAPILAVDAVPPATVEGMQMPAWRVRTGVASALAPGESLAEGDVIRTGAAARVLLRLGEGSTVKLGEQAELDLATLAPPPDDAGVFKGFLDVLKGAFRFTTTAVGADRSRDISARITTVTIGIRGTDVWGKTQDDRDFLVLLEGEVTIEREGVSLTLTEPLSLYDAPRGQPARPVAPVDPDDLARWAQETELQAGAGVLRFDGAWEAVLASYHTADAAAAAAARLQSEGYAVRIEEVEVAGATWHRIVIDALADRAEAEALAESLRGRFDVSSPWVRRR
jgi:hypothetical protein